MGLSGFDGRSLKSYDVSRGGCSALFRQPKTSVKTFASRVASAFSVNVFAPVVA